MVRQIVVGIAAALAWVVLVVDAGEPVTKLSEQQSVLHQDYRPVISFPSVEISQEYDSLEEAALYAEEYSYNKDYRIEYGGNILKAPDGKYVYTMPDTSYSDDSVHINNVKAYGDYIPVAQYHDHPCLPYSHFPMYFSEPDIANALHLSVIAIVANLCTGEIHEYDWTRDPVENVEIHVNPADLLKKGDDPEVFNLTTGRVVGKIPLTRKPVILEPNLSEFYRHDDVLVPGIMLNPDDF